MGIVSDPPWWVGGGGSSSQLYGWSLSCFRLW